MRREAVASAERSAALHCGTLARVARARPADRTAARAVPVLLAIDIAFSGGVLYPWLADLGPALSAAGLIGFAAARARGWPTGRPPHCFTRPNFQRTLLGATAVVAVVGGLEYAAQLAMRLGWIQPYRAMETLVPDGTADFRAAHVTADRRREPDPVLWWRPKDRAPYNAQRMKGPLATVPKPAGQFRILCYGDSNTDGPASGSWPEELHRRLRGTGGGRFEVLNAGVAGYSSHQGLLRFLADADRYQPDLLLISFGWNDATTVGLAPDHAYTPPPAVWAALQRVMIRYDFFRTLLHLPHLRRASGSETAYRGPRVPLDRYLDNLEQFQTRARARGASVAFLTRPFRAPAGVSQSPPWWRRVAHYNEALREWGAREHAAVIDVQGDFAADRPEFFADASHFNDAGRRGFAAFLERRLRAEGLLPPLP